MNWSCFIIIYRKPGAIYTLAIWHFIENAVTPKKNEIMRVLDFERLDVWNCNHNVWISPILLVFCLNVSECPWYWQASRQDPMRPHHVRTLDPNSSKRRNFSHGLRLVNFASVLLNSHLFKVIVRSMVSWKRINFVSSFCTHDCSWVADIRNIDHIVDYKASDGTWSTFIKVVKSSVSLAFILLVNHVQKHFLRFCKAIPQSVFGIRGKGVIANNKLVKIVSQKISTHVSSVSVIDSKEGAFGPGREVCFVGWTSHVQNDRHSIFIVISNNALMSVGSVGPDNPVSF